MLNISRQIYYGWDPSKKHQEMCEAEVIPAGDSVNEKKKLQTIVNRLPNLTEQENVPLPGFTLLATNRKKYGSADPTWLVIDPRGFLVRITNENLEMILQVSGITEGLIQQKCVWARQNTQTTMSLIPISSPNYKLAIENTQLIEDQVDIKDVNIGDKVLLPGGVTGIYKGVLSLYGSVDVDRMSNQRMSVHKYLRRQVIEISTNKYYHRSDAKILKVLERSKVAISREESAIELNSQIRTGAAKFSDSVSYFGTFGRDRPKFVSTDSVQKVKLSTLEINSDEALNTYMESYATSDCGILLLEKSSGEQSILDIPFLNVGNITHAAFDICTLVGTLETNTNTITLRDPKTYWGRNNRIGLYSLDNFAKFYKIVKHVKNNTYI